jgi:DnaJ-class molecular chaperone
MYCGCHRPKIVINTAMGESFEVCSENLGGCGQEVRTKPPELPKIKDDIDFGMFELVECDACGGSGTLVSAYPTGNGRDCEKCYGTGVI